jgi:fatty-acyl-CoA synthase
MVAVVTVGGLDLEGFRAHLATRLPEYARPVFVRLLSEIATTGTFKPQKQDLIRIGFDPSASTDPLYAIDRQSGAFVPLDSALFECIHAGRFRF